MFIPYDIVRIRRLPERELSDGLSVGWRLPRVGDIATVVEVYVAPVPGYELECTTSGGTAWLNSFAAEEIGLELVSRHADPDEQASSSEP